MLSNITFYEVFSASFALVMPLALLIKEDRTVKQKKIVDIDFEQMIKNGKSYLDSVNLKQPDVFTQLEQKIEMLQWQKECLPISEHRNIDRQIATCSNIMLQML